MPTFKLLLPYLLLLLIVGCFHKATPVSDDACGGNLAFLRDGYVTKDEILKARGEPSYAYKAGRIIIYEITTDDALYQLVLVFDENYVLSRHSCVRK